MNYEEFCDKFQIKLNNEQEMAVKRVNGPTLLVAVPGSGKTTVIISRIAYMIYCEGLSPDKILTVTFSVDAARAMKEKYLKRFGTPDNVGIPEFKTIHSISLEIIKNYCKRYGRKPFDIIENNHLVIRKVFERLSIKDYSDNSFKEVVNEITKAKNLMKKEEQLSEIKVNGLDFVSILKSYESYKSENHLMDFDDILIFANRILKRYPDILSIYQDRYEYFNVDEAQDNSLVQNKIMQVMASRHNNLFMVGDEDQCIYGFRGAYPQSFFEFTEKWGKENVLKLQTNYRSKDEILTASEKFIEQNESRISKKLSGVKGQGGTVCHRVFDFLHERNQYICDSLIGCSSAAVLARNNDSFISVINALIDSETEFNIKPGQTEFFSSRPVKDILFMLRKAIATNDEEAPKHLRTFLKGKDFVTHMGRLDPSHAIRFILKDMGYFQYIQARRYDGCAYQSVYSKLNGLESAARSTKCIDEFIKRLETINTICIQGKTGGNISLLTCHGSKGLEFEKICIIDVMDKVFPACNNVGRGQDNSDVLEEEIRLFYVALTRAMEEAAILDIKTSYYGICDPSIFVKQLRNIIAM